MRTKIENFLEKFPKDATSWADATDEIRDLSRESREYLEECDGVEVEPVDFKACKTPAEWNTRGRESILANFERMRPTTQKAFYERFREWFEPEPRQPKKPWVMRLVNGKLRYFDTNEEMVAYSARPDVSWTSMGASSIELND